MVVAKGAGLEELARAYFARQGFVAIRSVSIQFEDEEVTDVDVWLYGRQGAGIRTRGLVDVKDKRSPKAFERVLWARGMQLALGCDRAFVATTDASPKVIRFAQQQKVALLPAAFLRRPTKNQPDRLSLEELTTNIQQFSSHKQDGDWLKQIAVAKSAVVSLPPYPAFNKAMAAFRFFAERAATRPQHREQALRGAYFAASLASVALDAASERLAFEDDVVRQKLLYAGVTYGDMGDGRTKSSINTVLDVIERGVNNGKVIARQTRDAIDEMFAGLRTEIIAEFFAKSENLQILFAVARELEGRAHARSRSEMIGLSVEAKSVLGVFADFVGAKRTALFSADFPPASVDSKLPPVAPTNSISVGPADVEDDDTFPGDRPARLL